MGNQADCGPSRCSCDEGCAAASLADTGGASPQEDVPCCEPAGAVFEETLAGLGDPDRQLLLFSSSGNVAAVRWMVALHANPLARDTNRTSCLHAACRRGSPAVVETLLEAAASVEATDVAGWTPLHTAAFVGRPGVVSILLGCGADSRLRSLAGQCAADLCSDARTRGRLVVAAPPQPPAARPRSVGGLGAARLGAEAVPCIIDVEGSGTPWQETANPEKTQAEVRYEPFFVPRSPVIDCQDQLPNFNRLLTSIGQVIFDKQPGRGLAFLVATGALRDYPVDMIGFLRSGILHPASIGEFLGEDFSLSRVLRMEFFNLMRLRGCGVVASLAKVGCHRHVYALQSLWSTGPRRHVGRTGAQTTDVLLCTRGALEVSTPGFRIRISLHQAFLLQALGSKSGF